MDNGFNDNRTPTINFADTKPVGSTEGSEKIDMDDVLERLYGEFDPKDVVYKYIKNILTGNPLEQLYEFSHLSDTQKKAILALQTEAVGSKLREYIERRDLLAGERESLETRNNELRENNKYLENKIAEQKAESIRLAKECEDSSRNFEEIQRAIAIAEVDLSKKQSAVDELVADGIGEVSKKLQKSLNRGIEDNHSILEKEKADRRAELDELLANELKKVQDAIAEKNDKLEKELNERKDTLERAISILEKEKGSLEEVVGSLKETYDKYTELTKQFVDKDEELTTNPSVEMIKRESHFQRMAIHAKAGREMAEYQLNEFITKVSKLLPREVVEQLTSEIMDTGVKVAK